MRALALSALALLLGLTAVRAELPGVCGVASNLVEPDFGLALTAKAIEKKSLTIVVVGAGSSTLPGADAKAYPARLQVALSGQLPGVAVKVHADVKSGRTAAESIKPIISELSALHPALVIWQAGTVDAMRSVDLDEFSGALDKGIDAAHAAGSDVVLINAQYSPRTESIIALGAYADNMRWVALRHDIPLFDRFSVMKLWAELGTFDFTTATKKLDMAEHVHDCVGRLLAELIVSAAKSVEAPPPGVR
jgi:hypothetical protein